MTAVARQVSLQEAALGAKFTQVRKVRKIDTRKGCVSREIPHLAVPLFPLSECLQDGVGQRRDKQANAGWVRVGGRRQARNRTRQDISSDTSALWGRHLYLRRV